MGDFLLWVLASFLGSFTAFVLATHWDLEDKWRLWRARRARSEADRRRREGDRAYSQHMELLEEERRREHEREHGPNH